MCECVLCVCVVAKVIGTRRETEWHTAEGLVREVPAIGQAPGKLEHAGRAEGPRSDVVDAVYQHRKPQHQRGGVGVLGREGAGADNGGYGNA